MNIFSSTVQKTHPVDYGENVHVGTNTFERSSTEKLRQAAEGEVYDEDFLSQEQGINVLNYLIINCKFNKRQIF